LLKVPLGLDFILYKHGPFSFDLRDELTGYRADDLVSLESQWPYGARIRPTDRADYIQGLFSKTVAQYKDRVAFVAEKLGHKGVAELERVATALFVTGRLGSGASTRERAQELTRLKPHVSLEDALAAVDEVDGIRGEARKYLQ